MAEENTEQLGASTPQAADKAAERAAPKTIEAPSNALSAIKQVDKTILRLNK